MSIKIEIEGIHDFIRFVRIIRNEPISPEEIEKLANQLNISSEVLKKTVEENQPS